MDGSKWKQLCTIVVWLQSIERRDVSRQEIVRCMMQKILHLNTGRTHAGSNRALMAHGQYWIWVLVLANAFLYLATYIGSTPPVSAILASYIVAPCTYTDQENSFSKKFPHIDWAMHRLGTSPLYSITDPWTIVWQAIRKAISIPVETATSCVLLRMNISNWRKTNGEFRFRASLITAFLEEYVLHLVILTAERILSTMMLIESSP